MINNDTVVTRLFQLMEENCKSNENRALLTLDEINAEIAAVRAERKAKMKSQIN